MKKIAVLLLLLPLFLYGNKNEVLEEIGYIPIKDDVAKIFSVEGYFRSGMWVHSNYDLDSYYIDENRNILGSSKNKPTLDEIDNTYNTDITTTYNIRFRLSPTVEIGEYFKAVATFDIFDNVVAGASSDKELDKINIKEGYAVFKSSFGLFTFGRVATEWGLGIFRNDGKGKFANGGTYIDQAKFSTKFPVPMFDNFALSIGYEFNESGLNSKDLNDFTRYANDLDDNDDRITFTISVSDRLEGNELKELLKKGENRLNWQFYWGYMSQDKRSIPGTNENGTDFIYESNGLSTMILDLYFAFYMNTAFKAEGELFFANDDDFTVWGGVLNTTGYVMGETVKFGLDFGISGGNKTYNPHLDMVDTSSDIPFGKAFSFHSDYDIDLIFFKEVASLTSAYYIKPHATFMFSEQFGLSLWAVISRALDKEETYGKDEFLAVEIDTRLEYATKDGLSIGIAGGLLFPGAGMDWLGNDREREATEMPENKVREAGIAWTVQAFFSMKF